MSGVDMVTDDIEQAWKAFQVAIAERMHAHGEDNHILWEMDVPERNECPCGPYVQVSWSDDDERLVAEVSGNRVLADKFRLTKDLRRHLRLAGWNRPDEDHPNYWIDVDPAFPDRPAAMLVAALRDVFGVVHPAFLVDRLAEDVAVASDAGSETEQVEQTDLLGIAEPVEGPDELNAMVDIALGSDMGRPAPTRDDDGDIPYVAGSAVVFVRVLQDKPMIRVFSELVVEVTNPEAAAFEVSVLNRDYSAVKFLLREDRVLMVVEVQAQPFVPEHLRSAIAGLYELAPTLDSDLAHRVGGRRFLEPSEESR